MFNFSIAPFAIAQEEVVYIEGADQYIPVVPFDVVEIPPSNDGKDLGEFLTDLGIGLQEFFNDLGDKLGGGFSKIFGELGEKFKGGFEKLGGILGGLSDKLGGENGIGGLLGGKMKGAFGGFAGEIKGIFGKLGGAFGGKDGLGKLGGIFDEVHGGLSKIFGSLKDRLGGIFAELKGKLPPSLREEVERAEAETDTAVEDLRAATEAAVDAAEEEACTDPNDPNNDPCSADPAPDAAAEGLVTALAIDDKNPGSIGAFFARLGERVEEYFNGCAENNGIGGGLAFVCETYQEFGAQLNDSFTDLAEIFQEFFDVLGVAAGDVNGDGLRGSSAQFAARIQGIFGSLAGHLEAAQHSNLMEEEGIYYFLTQASDDVHEAIQHLSFELQNTMVSSFKDQLPPELHDEVDQALAAAFANIDEIDSVLQDGLAAIEAELACQQDPKSCPP